MSRPTTFGRAPLVLILLSVHLGIGGPARAQTQLDAIVTFGTSLSDSGNAFALIKTNATPPDFGIIPESFLVPSAPYARGGHHLSNGPTWVEQLAKSLHVTASANPAFASRNPFAMNYAIAGARAVDADPAHPTLPNLTAQLAAFLQDVGGAAPPNALYAIEIGSNDVRDAMAAAGGGGNPDAIVITAVEAIGRAIDTLYAAGARQFLIVDVPPIALTPAVRLADMQRPGTALAASLLTLDFNQKLMTMLATKAAYPGITIDKLDVYSLVASIVASPQSFGLSNVTDACITPNEAPFTCKDPNTYLFWDGIHPTTAVHAIFAERAEVAVGAP